MQQIVLSVEEKDVVPVQFPADIALKGALRKR